MTYIADSTTTAAWLFARAGVQALLVLLLARELGPETYGQFVSAIALASFAIPLATLGIPEALLRDLSRCSPGQARTYQGEVIGLWIHATLSTAALVSALTALIPNGTIAVWAVALLAASEVISYSGMELFARMRQAQRHLAQFGQTMFAPPAARLGAIAVCAIFEVQSTETWVVAYAVAGIVPVAVLLLTSPPPCRTPWRRKIALARAGRPFALSFLVTRLQAELNKPLLAQTSYASAGQFTVAQRLIDVALLPLQAALESLLPRLYANRDNPLDTLKRVGAVLLFTGLTIGFALNIAGTYILDFFGSGYQGLEWILIALLPLPALRIAIMLGNAALVATDQASHLSKAMLGGGILGSLCTLALIPWLGVTGAISSLYAGYLTTLSIQVVALRSER